MVSPFIRLFRCSRFCSGLAYKDHPNSPDFNRQAAIGTIQVTSDHHVSTSFTKDLNLVRHQGVGGSNPLSPTNLFIT